MAECSSQLCTACCNWTRSTNFELNVWQFFIPRSSQMFVFLCRGRKYIDSELNRRTKQLRLTKLFWRTKCGTFFPHAQTCCEKPRSQPPFNTKCSLLLSAGNKNANGVHSSHKMWHPSYTYHQLSSSISYVFWTSYFTTSYINRWFMGK